MASPNLKIHLSSRPRQRGSHKSSKIRELDSGQIVSVFSVEGTVTLELAFSATLDAVPSPPDRTRYHRLLTLKDAYKTIAGFSANTQKIHYDTSQITISTISPF